MTIRTSSCVIPIPNRPTDWLIVDTNQVRVTHLAKRSSSSEASIVNLPITVTVTVTLCNRCYCNWVSLVIDDCFYGCLCTVGFSSSEVQYFVPLKLLCFMSSLSASLFSGSLGRSVIGDRSMRLIHPHDERRLKIAKENPFTYRRSQRSANTKTKIDRKRKE